MFSIIDISINRRLKEKRCFDINKLKLLVIMKDYSKFVHSEPHYLAEELALNTDLIVWNEPGNIHEILKEIRFTPDFILIYLYRSAEQYSPPISGLSTLKIPFGVYVEDLHNLINFSQGIIEDKVQHIFTCYRDTFYKMYPDFIDKVRWLPHHVNTKIFKNYLMQKDLNMLLMGAKDKNVYPLRHKIIKKLKKNPDFLYHRHPGYRNIENTENQFVKENYAKEINRAKVFFTCDSIYQYPILKFFEVPACHTLLLAPSSKELFDLGFRPGENFVEINNKNFINKASYYLQNDEERERITANGFKLVHERHTSEIRAKELIDMIKEIIQ